MTNVKDVIKGNRIKLQMTMMELAKKIGVNVSTVSRWESGDVANMTRKNMIQLAKALNISPMDLLDNDDGYYNDPEVAILTEALRTNPNGRILFDASKNLKKEDIQFIVNMINELKKKEGIDD